MRAHMRWFFSDRQGLDMYENCYRDSKGFFANVAAQGLCRGVAVPQRGLRIYSSGLGSVKPWRKLFYTVLEGAG